MSDKKRNLIGNATHAGEPDYVPPHGGIKWMNIEPGTSYRCRYTDGVKVHRDMIEFVVRSMHDKKE